MTEQIQEMARSSVETATENVKKAKSKAKGYKTEFDHTRQMGPDARDPRLLKTTWPCFNQHVPEKGSNRWGLWEQCAKCALRMAYTPAVGAQGQSTKTELTQNVQEALHRLRTDGHEANDMTSHMVKSMITIVAKEKALLNPKQKAKAKSAAKSPPQISMQVGDSSDEDVKSVATFSEETVKKEKKKGRSAAEE